MRRFCNLPYRTTNQVRTRVMCISMDEDNLYYSFYTTAVYTIHTSCTYLHTYLNTYMDTYILYIHGVKRHFENSSCIISLYFNLLTHISSNTVSSHRSIEQTRRNVFEHAVLVLSKCDKIKAEVLFTSSRLSNIIYSSVLFITIFLPLQGK